MASCSETQVDSVSDCTESVESIDTFAVMSDDQPVFDVKVDDVSISEQEVARQITPDFTAALVDEAREYVEQAFARYVSSSIPALIKKCKPDIAEEVKEQWMHEHYFSQLSTFLHQKRTAFRAQVDVNLLSKADAEKADEMHKRLERSDEVEVQQALNDGFQSYYLKLDEVQRQVCDTDENVKATFRSRWMSTNYVSTVLRFLEVDKNKFKPDALMNKLSDEKVVQLQELCCKLTAADSEEFEVFLLEKWVAYEASMDEAIKETCSKDAVKDAWKLLNYVSLIEQFLREKRPGVMTSSPSTPTSNDQHHKRSADAASLASPLKTVKVAKTPSHDGSNGGDDRFTKLKRASSANLGDFTSVIDLGKALTTSFSVIGKMLACLSDVQSIETKAGKSLLTFRYLIGDHTGVVEVTQVGQSCLSLMQQVKELQGAVVVLNKAGWSEQRKQLQHNKLTVLERADAAHTVASVKYPLFDDFHELPRLPTWTRVSLDCYLCDPGCSVPAELSGRSTNGWQRDCTICSVRAKGIQLRVVHSHEHELDHFEEGLALQIRYGKTFTGGIYVDTSDLASLSSSSSPTCDVLRPRMDMVQRVPW